MDSGGCLEGWEERWTDNKYVEGWAGRRTEWPGAWSLRVVECARGKALLLCTEFRPLTVWPSTACDSVPQG